MFVYFGVVLVLKQRSDAVFQGIGGKIGRTQLIKSDRCQKLEVEKENIELAKRKSICYNSDTRKIVCKTTLCTQKKNRGVPAPLFSIMG